MTYKEKIDIVRANWTKAARELNFNIISPYYVTVKNEVQIFFGYIPKYGSPSGTIIELVCPPNYEHNDTLIKAAEIKGCFYSFINIDFVLNYNIETFRDIIKDWRHY